MEIKDIGNFIGQRVQAAKAYFKPTPELRARDFVREVPGAVWKVAKQIPQDVTRFGISAAEVPYNFATKGKTTGYHNVPMLGRLNSFQDESKNRINRGDGLASSMGIPMAKTLLAGSDLSPAMRLVEKPLEVGYQSLKMRKILKNNLKNNEAMVINPDNLKELSGWRGMQQPQYHEMMSQASDNGYNWALQNNPNPIVRRTAGGPGSGKTDFVLNPIKKDFNGIVLDKVTGNIEGFKRDYEAAKNAGKGTEVYGVLPDVKTAKGYTISRGKKTGRYIPDEAFNNYHANSPNTLSQIAKNYQDVPVRLNDLRGINNKQMAQQNSWMTNRNEISQLIDKLGYTPEEIARLLSL